MSEQAYRWAEPIRDQAHDSYPDAGRDDRRRLAFGQCTISPAARALVRKGVRIELGSRAFDLLLILLMGRGRIVTKEEIMRFVWPCTTVDESNVRVQMACLRKALGSDAELIRTIPGRGYMAVAEEDDAEAQATAPLFTLPFERTIGAPSIVIVGGLPQHREALHRLLGSLRIGAHFPADSEAAAGARAQTVIALQG